jgi:nickel-dependent lactate racemase
MKSMSKESTVISSVWLPHISLLFLWAKCRSFCYNAPYTAVIPEREATMANAKNTVTVPQLAWSGDIDAELTFPDNWQVIPSRMNGHSAPKLTDEGYRKALANPIGSKPIRELAKGKKSVVILFDDLSRPTKAAEIVPYVLEELAAGGIEESNIQFICALGNHGALTAFDYRKKLGADVVARFNVYNHNPYENCSYVGKTRRGTPVSINTEFMNADLKIGVGCIVPHPMTGFGGGAKIILPGVASIDTVEHNHHTVPEEAEARGTETAFGMANSDNNAILLDMQDTCRMSGLDVKVDAIVNIRRETTALFVGEPIAQYEEGLKLAREHYKTQKPDGAQVIVSNANAKVNEATIASGNARALLGEEEEGTVVLVSNNPYGEVPHYLYRRFGDEVSGRRWNPRPLPPNIKKFIVLMPWPDKASMDWIAPAESVTWARSWNEVLTVLEADYPNGTRAGVIPDGTIQYFA